MTVFARYWLLQIPGATLCLATVGALYAWAELPLVWAFGLTSAWFVKDLAMYPILRHAYSSEPSQHVGVARVVGSLGRVEEALDPAGTVDLSGERWQGESASGEVLPAGTRVRVVAVRDLTLLVLRD